jgi:hypothetical protein
LSWLASRGEIVRKKDKPVSSRNIVSNHVDTSVDKSVYPIGYTDETPSTSKSAVKPLDWIERELEKYSRIPFQDNLRLALENAPSPESLAQMAAGNPLRWANYTAILAKLSGYQETSNVHHTHKVIQDMSSQELDAELAALDAKQRVIDIQFKQLEGPTPSLEGE